MSVKLMELPEIDCYSKLLGSDIPLIDVRAPVEFTQGAFPFASNYPLMNDEERHLIGICYKQHGQQKAIELGQKLVSGDVKHTRVDHWEKFAKQHPKGALYCFRGGLRSKIAQQWIYEQTGILYPRVKGGYKALRHFLLEQLDSLANRIEPVIIGGRTGVGKTLLLHQLHQQIDLEGIYGHRGSAFGKHVYPQPSQIDVENDLSIAMLKFSIKGIYNIALEDEAANIGSRQLPKALFQKMQQAPLILLEASVDQRVNIVFNEYVTEALKQFSSVLGECLGIAAWIENLTSSLAKIKRRLGGARFKELHEQVMEAISIQKTRQDAEHHKQWIKILLTEYYDPMYDYQISKKEQRIIFSGEQDAVIQYLESSHNIQ